MSEKGFTDKWNTIKTESQHRDNTEERSIFVDVGKLPESQRQFNLYNYFEYIKCILEKNKVKNVLEIGCGRGTIGLYCAKHLGLEVSLLDNVPDALNLAREEFKVHKQTASFHVEDVLETSLPDNSYDAVISIGLAEHFNESKVGDLFKEQYRLLRPGGVMVSLNIPKKPSIQILNIWMRCIKKLLGLYTESVGKDYYRNSFTPKEFRSAAERVGFTGVYTIWTFPFPFFIPVRKSTDRFLTKAFLKIVAFRRIFMSYPYKTNRFLAQSHFLVGYKPD